MLNALIIKLFLFYEKCVVFWSVKKIALDGIVGNIVILGKVIRIKWASIT